MELIQNSRQVKVAMLIKKFLAMTFIKNEIHTAISTVYVSKDLKYASIMLDAGINKQNNNLLNNLNNNSHKFRKFRTLPNYKCSYII